MTSVLILLVLYILGYTDSVLSAATIEPDSLNVSLNSIATFTCSSFGANFLYFTIDEVSVTDSVNNDRGLNEGSQDVINGTRYRDLTVEAKVTNNNTNISCIRIPGEITAEPALLRIQGLLASVGDLNYTYIDGSNVNLTWKEPYSLDNVPITGYHVDDGFNNFNTTNNDSSIVLSATDPDVCNITIITISPINGAGIGEPNNISFYYQRVPSTMPPVSVVPAVNGARQVSLNISIDVSGLCIGEYPNIITVIILDINNVVQVFNIPPQVNNQMIISRETDTSFVIPNNAMYSFNVTALMSNNGGDFQDEPPLQFILNTVGPVTAISSVIDNCSTITVSWDSPHMLFILKVLNGTGYTLDNVTVNGTSYEFKDTDLFRHRYTYVITEINELGRGVSSNKTFSYQQIPRAANAIVSFGEYIQNNVTVNFTIPIILECTGEAPENVTVILQCNETGIVFNTTYTVESDSRPMDITEQLSLPLYQECNISALFINANGSDSFIMEFNTIPPMTPPPSTTDTTPSPSPIFTTRTIIIIITIVGILLISLVLVIVLSLLLCYRKSKKKHSDNPDSPNLLGEQVVFDGSNVRTSFDSTKGLLAFKSSTDEQPTTPTSPTNPTSATSATGANGAAKEPIYSDLGQAPKGGVEKPPQSEATVQYADIDTIVPKQRATQSYDDVVVGAGTTVIGGGPAVPPPVPAKGGESRPPPVPKKTKGATTTQMETKDNDAARNLPHHVENENFSYPPPSFPPPHIAPVTEEREGGEEGGGPNVGATTEIHGTGLVSYL